MTIDQFYEDCTLEQRNTLRRLAKKYGYSTFELVEKASAPTVLCPWVGVSPHDAYIGIEKDGYSHT